MMERNLNPAFVNEFTDRMDAQLERQRAALERLLAWAERMGIKEAAEMAKEGLK